MQPSVTNVVRSPMFWGTASLALLTAAALVIAMVFVNPPGEQVVSFDTDDAVSVNAGDTVRVAGIIVGKVKDLSLEHDRVKVRMSIDKGVFIGDQSQVQVRMLTVVGGYYVTVIPLGDAALGKNTIPMQRVTMPYSLIRTLTDATKIPDEVAPRPINESISQLQHGLTGSNTNALAEVLAAGNTVTQIMDRQRGQLTSILKLSNEYISRLNGNRQLLEFLFSRISILEQTLVLYGQGFAGAINGLGQVVGRLEPITSFYMFHRYDFLARVRGILGDFQTIADRNGTVVRVLRRIRERMENTIGAQNNGTPPELFATDLCVPTEGSTC